MICVIFARRPKYGGLVACKKSCLQEPVTLVGHRVYRMTVLSKPSTVCDIKLNLEGSRILNWLPVKASFSSNYLPHFQVIQSGSSKQRSGTVSLVVNSKP